MTRRLPRKARMAGREARVEGATSPYSLDIEMDEGSGRLRIYDPRAFVPGRRAFCRRLLEVAVEHPGLERAEIDLAASSCTLDFGPGAATASMMAEVMTAAIRRAAADRPSGDRDRWWSLPSRWSGLAAFRTPEGVSWWEAIESRPGRIRLRLDDPSKDPGRLGRVAEALATLDGIEGTCASNWSRTLTIDLHPDGPLREDLLDAAERARRDSRDARATGRALATTAREADAGEIVVAAGFRRLGYLAMAGGSFALTVIGLVIPGIPTVPFLLATGYYLARSSPRLNERLRRMPVFGPILVEWERHHGLSRSSKANLLGLTAAIIAVTVVLSGGSPVVLVVILAIAAISAYGIARLPGLPDEAPAPQGPTRPARLALPSP